MFNEIGLVRRDKREHLNKLFPWHNHIRANITNIEIPEEMSPFTERETLTDNDSERGVRGPRRAAAWRRTLQWTNAGASQEQRSSAKRRSQKASASW